MAEDSSRSENRQPLCLTCWHWQGALDLPTGTIGQLYACIRQVPGAGSRYECNEYDRDPMRAKIDFFELPSTPAPPARTDLAPPNLLCLPDSKSKSFSTRWALALRDVLRSRKR